MTLIHTKPVKLDQINGLHNDFSIVDLRDSSGKLLPGFSILEYITPDGAD